LEPVTTESAHAILAGDLSGVTVAEGLPHEDTSDGLALAIKYGHPPGWLITAEGTVIGECGAHGPIDEAGCVEIGYGLAAPYRQGYGSEAVATGGEAASKIGPGTTDRNRSGHARLDGGQPGRGLAAAPSCSAMVETGRRRLRRGCGRPRLRAAPSASARVQG